MTLSLEDPIALEARDTLPETWDALKDDDVLGVDGLLRRYKRTVRSILGTEPTEAEQDALDDRLIVYVGKKLALSIIVPGRDYWSKQVIQRSAGERESKAFLDRGKDLKELGEQLTKELAELDLEIGPLLPVAGRGRVKDSPRVVQAGDTVAHLTPNLDNLEPLFGPPDGTAAT